MHIGLVNINNEKMSKSLNNFVSIEEALNDNPAEVLRYLLLASHYRSPVNYSKNQLQAAKQSLTRLYGALDGLDLNVEPDLDSEAVRRFHAALHDDFNVSGALAICFEMAKAINKFKSDNDLTSAAKLAKTMQTMLQPLNLLQADFGALSNLDKIDEDLIAKLITERNLARANKDWTKSDQIRDKLLGQGVELHDGADGTSWR